MAVELDSGSFDLVCWTGVPLDCGAAELNGGSVVLDGGVAVVVCPFTV